MTDTDLYYRTNYECAFKVNLKARQARVQLLTVRCVIGGIANVSLILRGIETLMSTRKQHSDQTFGGVMLIGLAVLFLTGYWWPGVMFVIGAAMIARTVSEGGEWSSNRNALVTLGIGVVFALFDVLHFLSGNIIWPLILIGVGAYLLFGDRLRGSTNGKPKNDDTI
jgi:hypothetical protein